MCPAPRAGQGQLENFGEYMAKRLIVTLLAMAAILGTLGFVKFRQVEAAIAQGASFQIPATAVTTVVAKRETWPSTLTVIGTAAAVQGVTVSADLPGTIDKIHFESGQWVHEGDILVELDIRQERAQLANLEAQRDLANINYGRAQELDKAGVIAHSEYDNASAQQKATQAQVGDIKAAIARKTIRAPFYWDARHSPGEFRAISGRRSGDCLPAICGSYLCEFRSSSTGCNSDETGARAARNQWRPTGDGIHWQNYRARFCRKRPDTKYSSAGDPPE